VFSSTHLSIVNAAGIFFLQVGGFLCECRAVAKLVLDLQVRTAVVGVLVSEYLSTLVARRFTAARDTGHLVFSSTHLSIVNAAGISVSDTNTPTTAVLTCKSSTKRLATRVERYSDSPNCIVEVEWR
jgi:hypothetical protein